MNCNEAVIKFFNSFGDHAKMVLSTSMNDLVTSRMMSIVIIRNELYFQTDCKSRKYAQMKQNSHVSLCIDNVQIDGICSEIGKPVGDDAFISLFQKHFGGSYKAYTLLEDERLFKVTPTFIERWLYIESNPYIETIDLSGNRYNLEKYSIN